MRDPQLLDPREQEALVWGIGRFVADEPTRRLDLRATVRATARAAGFPRLHFERAVYHREVWLWVDETADDPAIERLANEVERTLAIHGLPVERAVFRGVPERLVTPEGQVFAPREVDERRNVALVAVLTDGRLLARHHAADNRRVALEALLRMLSHWPRLAFVDFSGGSQLERILEPHAIESLAPAELAAFLGGDSASASAASEVAGSAGDLSWAAACALAPSSVDEATAFELRSELGLDTSPWALRALRAEAPGPPGRLRWPPGLRARRVEWLRDAEGTAAAGAGDEHRALLDRGLDFWEAKYDAELERQELDTPAARRLEMERLLLHLWRQPGAAVRRLYALFQGPLEEAIRRHLGSLAPDDTRRARRRMRLPWRWAERSPAEKAMLQKMGFGGDMPAESLRRPGRLWVGVAACAGLALGALASAFLSSSGETLSQPVFEHDPPPEFWQDAQELDDGRWRASVGTRRWSVMLEVDRGSRLEVAWARESHSCVQAGGNEVWRCARRSAPPVLPERVRSVAFLDAGSGGPALDEMAAALLDSGSADVVYVLRQRDPDYVALLPLAARFGRPQVIVVTLDGDSPIADGLEELAEHIFGTAKYPLAWVRGTSWLQLVEALRFEGSQNLAEVWGGVVAGGNPASVLLNGLGSGCQPIEETENGITFVRICRGTFMMGSPDTEEDHRENEVLYEVTLSEYWIGKHEITQEQYEDVAGENPSHFSEAGSDLPVETVTWHQADAFCKNLGYRLPTEAEWEHAARAGEQARWSFGYDESQLGDHAWFRDNSDLSTHPVGRKLPNAWGLHDMHGNVWEWVGDGYGPYPDGPVTNPTGVSSSSDRVLRGGSFADSPRYLRSALRVRYGPEDSFRGIGFRCVRGPRLQP